MTNATGSSMANVPSKLKMVFMVTFVRCNND